MFSVCSSADVRTWCLTLCPSYGRFASQLLCDQQAALHPDTETPFLSAADAVKRLSKYHVLQEVPPEPDEVLFEDEVFRARAEYICHKRHIMYNKYRRLLLKESMVRWGCLEGRGRGGREGEGGMQSGW